jgi:hypothetical protein
MKLLLGLERIPGGAKPRIQTLHMVSLAITEQYGEVAASFAPSAQFAIRFTAARPSLKIRRISFEQNRELHDCAACIA